MTTRTLTVLFVLLSAVPSLAQTPQACGGLRSLPLANTVVTTATVVSGSFTPPGSSNPNAALGNLPSFCRVAATLKPTPDSEINTEIWLPMAGWNRRLQSVGNGAWAGVIPYPAMAAAVTGGYRLRALTPGTSATQRASCPAIPSVWWITAIARFTR